jgi:hypothetical protein
MEILNLLRDLGIFGLAMWFIQLLLAKSADRKFESYKTELDHKSREFQATLDSKLELYKAELNLHNYKSTQIYERQLTAVIELHKKLALLNQAMQEMTAFMKLIHKDAEQEETERINKAATAYNEFLNFYLENQIYIPKATIDQIEKLKSEYFKSYNDYTFGRQFGLKNNFTSEKSIQAGEKVSNEIQPALNQLMVDFRELIGVEKSEKK